DLEFAFHELRSSAPEAPCCRAGAGLCSPGTFPARIELVVDLLLAAWTSPHRCMRFNDAAQWRAAPEVTIADRPLSARPLQQPGWVWTSFSKGGLVRATCYPQGRGGTTHNSQAARLARRDRD